MCTSIDPFDEKELTYPCTFISIVLHLRIVFSHYSFGRLGPNVANIMTMSSIVILKPGVYFSSSASLNHMIVISH